MKKPIALAIGCLVLAGGCASGPIVPRIEGVMRVSHGAKTAAGQLNVGRALLAKRRFRDAAEAYASAVALDPKKADAYNGLGVAYSMLGHHARAIEMLETATALSPSAAEFQNNLGFALLRASLPEAAARQFEKALELEPTNETARANLASFSPPGEPAAPTLSQNDAAPGTDVTAEQKLAPSITVAETPTQPQFDQTGASDSASQSAALAAERDANRAVNPQNLSLRTEVAHSTADSMPPGEAMRTEAPTYAQGAESEAVSDAPTTSSGTLASFASSGSESSLVAATVGTHRYLQSASGNLAFAATRPAARLEVVNGNGVRSAAARAAEGLRANGFGVQRLANLRPFVQQQTEIRYRPGFLESALHLQGALPVNAQLIEQERLRAGVDVRIVLGKDHAQTQFTLREVPTAERNADLAFVAVGKSQIPY